MHESGRLRIGELSRRVGVSPELLRAWETRYGLVEPERTSGGLRLYSEEDERRIRVMQTQIAAGFSAAEAAQVALGPAARPASPEILLADLDRELTALDEPAAQLVLDRIFATLELTVAIGEVIVPYLYRLGERWATGERTVVQEHFASFVIGGRLRELGRGWGKGDGPQALLACPAGEQHELGLLCFALLLREAGWRIAYIGAETPIVQIAEAVRAVEPDLVVVSSSVSHRYIDAAEGLKAIAAGTRMAIGGGGSSQAMADAIGAEYLGSDLLAAAHGLSANAS
jgi:DNA-binding transcriptional MerR regulator